MYIFSIFRYVAEVFGYVHRHKKQIGGYKITWAPTVLRHFSAHFVPMPSTGKKEEGEEEDDGENLEESLRRMRRLSVRRLSHPFI